MAPALVLASPSAFPKTPVPRQAPAVVADARVGGGVLAIPLAEEATAARSGLLVAVVRDARAEGDVVDGVAPILVAIRATDGDATAGEVLPTDQVATYVGAGAEAGAVQAGMEAPVGQVGLTRPASPGAKIVSEATAGVGAGGVLVVVVPVRLAAGVPAAIALAIPQVEAAVVVTTEAVVPIPTEDLSKGE